MVGLGDKIPDVELRTMGEDGNPISIRSGEALGTGTVVLFGVPGAFTPGCSRVHLPGYVSGADALRAKGVDTIACVAVNDAWVMQAWGESQGVVNANILLLADGGANFTKAMGLELDASPFGLGIRSRRYAALIQDGTIQSLEVEEGGVIGVSSCESTIGKL